MLTRIPERTPEQKPSASPGLGASEQCGSWSGLHPLCFCSECMLAEGKGFWKGRVIIRIIDNTNLEIKSSSVVSMVIKSSDSNIFNLIKDDGTETNELSIAEVSNKDVMLVAKKEGKAYLLVEAIL